MSISDTLVPNFIQRSFLVKVLLGVATIMVLTGLVGGYFYMGISSDLDEQVDRQVEATTVQHANASVNWFDNRFDTLRTVATEIEDRDRENMNPDQASGEELWTILSSLRNEYSSENVVALYYVDGEGTIRGATNTDYHGSSFVGDLGFEMSDFQGDKFVLPGQYTNLGGEEVMAIGMSSPLRGSGYYIAEVRSEDGGPLFEHGYEGAETSIVTGGDETLLGNDPGINMPGAVGNDYYQTSGNSNVYAYQPIPGYDNLFVVSETPQSSAFQLRSNVVFNFGLTLLFAFLILLGVTLVGGRSAIRDLNVLANRAEAMGEGDLDVDLETSRKDEIGVLYTTFDDMRTDLKERISEAEEARDEAESARKEAEVARAEAEEMATYLQDKAEEYSDIMQQVGMGDMTQRMTPDGEEESMDTIAEEFNDMIEELEKTTGQLKSYVDEVEEAGAEVEQSAETVRDASEQVADSIQKISDDAYNQKERLQDLSETMDEITGTLESLATSEDVDIDEPLANIRDIATDISDIADLSEETMAEAEHVAGAAEEQAAELNEVSERANDLQRYAQPLRDILGRFETEAEHEFVFSVGPTGGAQSPSSRSEDEE
jgi:methyl-accepting chemotaxis protein